MIQTGSDGKASDFIATSAGSADAGKVPKTGAGGKIDPSFGVPAIEVTVGATASLTTNGNQKVVVWAKGSMTNTLSGTVNLKYNGVLKDTVTENCFNTNSRMAFSLMYTETPAAGTYNITLDGVTITDPVIMVMKI